MFPTTLVEKNVSVLELRLCAARRMRRCSSAVWAASINTAPTSIMLSGYLNAFTTNSPVIHHVMSPALRVPIRAYIQPPLLTDHLRMTGRSKARLNTLSPWKWIMSYSTTRRCHMLCLLLMLLLFIILPLFHFAHQGAHHIPILFIHYCGYAVRPTYGFNLTHL